MELFRVSCTDCDDATKVRLDGHVARDLAERHAAGTDHAVLVENVTEGTGTVVRDSGGAAGPDRAPPVGTR